VKLLVVGAAIVDLVARPLAEPTQDSSNDADIRLGAGGAGRNVAENLLRLGCEVTLVADVADDALGQFLRADCARLGLDLRACRKPRTGLYLAVLHPSGALDRGYCQTATEQLTAAEVLEKLPDLGEFAGAVLDANLSEACLSDLAGHFRRAGLAYALETAAHQRCRRVLPALQGCALIKPDRGEAEALTGLTCQTPADALACARALTRRGVATAIVSLGPQGFCAVSGDFAGHLPALPTEVVDVTGAGDALFAAAWVGILRGLPLPRVLEAARRAASLAVASRESVSRALGPQLFDLA
jgi:pseudouridine kinase